MILSLHYFEANQLTSCISSCKSVLACLSKREVLCKTKITIIQYHIARYRLNFNFRFLLVTEMFQTISVCPSFQCQWKRCYCRLSSAVSLDWAVIRNGAGTQCSPWCYVSFYFYIARFVWEEWFSLELSLIDDLMFFLSTQWLF